MPMKAEGIWAPIFGASGAKIGSLVLSMVALSLTARWLGPEGRGIVAAVLTWTGLIFTVACLSLGQVAIHRATGRKDNAWLGPLLGTLAAFTVAVSLIGWGVLLAAYLLTQGRIFGGIDPWFLVIGFAGLPFFLWEDYGRALLVSIDRLSVYNMAQIVGKFAALGALVLFIPVMAWGVTGGLLAINLGQAVLACFGLRALARKSGARIHPDWGEFRILLSGGMKLHMNTVATLAFSASEILIIQYYRGARDTGLYQLAQQLVNIALVVPQAAGMVVYAKIVSMGADGIWPVHLNVLRKVSLLMLAGMLGAALTAPFMIPLIAGEAFTPSVLIFQIMLLTLLGKTASTLLAPQWIARGLFLQTGLITVLVGIVNLGGCFLFIPRYGVWGALGASVAANMLALLINFGLVFWISARVARKGRDASERSS